MEFFPEKGKEIKTSFWHIWIAQWLTFLCTTAYFFFILTIFRRKGGLKNGPEVLTLGQSLSYKYLNPSKNFPSNSVFVC